jgi:hypothetical protein
MPGQILLTVPANEMAKGDNSKEKPRERTEGQTVGLSDKDALAPKQDALAKQSLGHQTRSSSSALFSLVLASILTITIGGFTVASVIEFL